MTATQNLKKGGRPTPGAAGLLVPHRDALWNRLKALPEGAIFRPEALAAGLGTDALDDLWATTGYDHLHIADGWHTAIIETAHVRIAPNPVAVVQAWCNQHELGTPVIFGDWIANHQRLIRWEPIAGFRFRVPAPNIDTVLALGHMRVRIQTGPDWLLNTDPIGNTLRMLVDTPIKTIQQNITAWLHQGGHERQQHLNAARAILAEVDALWEESTAVAKGERPSILAQHLAGAA